MMEIIIVDLLLKMHRWPDEVGTVLCHRQLPLTDCTRFGGSAINWDQSIRAVLGYVCLARGLRGALSWIHLEFLLWFRNSSGVQCSVRSWNSPRIVVSFEWLFVVGGINWIWSCYASWRLGDVREWFYLACCQMWWFWICIQRSRYSAFLCRFSITLLWISRPGAAQISLDAKCKIKLPCHAIPWYNRRVWDHLDDESHLQIMAMFRWLLDQPFSVGLSLAFIIQCEFISICWSDAWRMRITKLMMSTKQALKIHIKSWLKSIALLFAYHVIIFVKR
jgi:hypothetical protein